METSLFLAIQHNDMPKVRAILKELPQGFNINWQAHLHSPPTHPPNHPSVSAPTIPSNIHSLAHDHTFLHIASACGRDHVVRLLLEMPDIDVNAVLKDGQTPFLLATWYGHLPVVKILLADKRVDINQTDRDGATPFWWAACWGRVKILQEMVASGRSIDLNAKALRGGMDERTTAYQIALKKGRQEVVAFLQEYLKKPLIVTHQLRMAQGCLEAKIAELFGIVVLTTDEYLQFKSDHQPKGEELKESNSCSSLPELVSTRQLKSTPISNSKPSSSSPPSPSPPSPSPSSSPSLASVRAPSPSPSPSPSSSSSSSAKSKPLPLSIQKSGISITKSKTAPILPSLHSNSSPSPFFQVLNLSQMNLPATLSFPKNDDGKERFLSICGRLPMEMQMKICNIMHNSSATFVLTMYLIPALADILGKFGK